MHCFLCRSSPRRWIKHVTLTLKECLIDREKTWFVLICYPPWPFDIIMQNFYKVFVILTSLLSSFSSISFVFFFKDLCSITFPIRTYWIGNWFKSMFKTHFFCFFFYFQLILPIIAFLNFSQYLLLWTYPIQLSL